MSSTDELLEACKVGDITKLTALLKDKDVDKEPLLIAAASANQPSVLQYFFTIDPSTKVSPQLIFSALGGGCGAYKALYEQDTSILHHEMGHLGDALTLATMFNKDDLVVFLLSKGVDPNESHMGYRPAIDVGASFATPEIMRALLSHGAKVDGTEALLSAVQKGRPDILRILCETGADLSGIFDSDVSVEPGIAARGTVLHLAKKLKRPECAEVLKEFGAPA